MQSLSSLRSVLGPITSFTPRCHGSINSISRYAASPGCLENHGFGICSLANFSRGVSSRHMPQHSTNLGMNFGLLALKEDVTAPFALRFRSLIHSSCPKDYEVGKDSNSTDFAIGRGDFEMGRSSRPNSNFELERNPRSMNFTAGLRDFQMGRNSRPIDFSSGQRDFEMRSYPSPMDFSASQRNSRPMDFVRGVIEQDVHRGRDFVFIKLLRNNTFVSVTDSKGNKKKKASMTAGWLQKQHGGPKLSRYAAEATSEYVGQAARQLGLRSCVMRVNGSTFFKWKRQSIMSFSEGFGRGGPCPITHIEDTTRLAHNGCRLPKKRRY